MEITAEMVKSLRTTTGAGILACRKALDEAAGEMKKAEEILRKKGLADAQRKAGRSASEGVIGSYIHTGSKIGVLVEVNCETDFVAKMKEFHDFVHDIAMQVAASSPQYVCREDVPAEVIEKEKEIYKAQAAAEGKPEKILDKIVEGKIEKTFFANACLLDQPFIRDGSKTVRALLDELRLKIRENIKVRRFARFKVGE